MRNIPDDLFPGWDHLILVSATGGARRLGASGSPLNPIFMK